MKVTLGSPCLFPGHHPEEDVLFSHLGFSRSCFCEQVESNQDKNRTLSPGGGTSAAPVVWVLPSVTCHLVGRTGPFVISRLKWEKCDQLALIHSLKVRSQHSL